MTPVLNRKLKLLALICTYLAVAGVLYELVDTGTAGGIGLSTGIGLGLMFGFLELFALERWGKRLRSMPFGQVIVVKTVIYTAGAYITGHSVGFLYGWIQGMSLDQFRASLISYEQGTFILVCLGLFAHVVFFLQVNQVMGQDTLMKFLRGRYHRPTEEERVFMFLDLRGSTAIAERLGSRYYSLLNEFFHDISQPVMMTGAEIYQYVGDEVVLTWKLRDGLCDANCIRAYWLINDAVARRADSYRREYGVVPEYKAGLHCGPVISAQIGDIKREIVYNGDVVNTTSRIQEKCGELGLDLLVSADLMERLPLVADYKAESLGAIDIEGKARSIELFAVQRPAR